MGWRRTRRLAGPSVVTAILISADNDFASVSRAHILLVVPPEILSDFRQHLDPTLKHALAGKLAEDLTKIRADKTLAHSYGVSPI